MIETERNDTYAETELLKESTKEHYEFVALDVETASRYNKGSICQIALVGYRQGETEVLFESLINPKMSIEPSLVLIHHITDDMVANAPRFEDIFETIRPILSENVIVAHNAIFDICAIEKAMFDCNIQPINITYGCTFIAARTLLSLDMVTSHKLSDLCEFYGIEQMAQHDASEDARSCALLAVAMMKSCNADGIEALMWRSGKALYNSLNNGYDPASTNSNLPKRKCFVKPSFETDICDCLSEKHVLFTGALDYCSRADAMKLAEAVGGIVKNEKGTAFCGVTKAIDVVVVGVQDIDTVKNDEGISSKHRKALELRNKGHHIMIIDELEFLRLVEGV